MSPESHSAASPRELRHEWTDIGARAQFGISNRLNFGVGYIRSDVSDGDFAMDTFLFGPKVSLVPDRVAFALPVGFSLVEGIDVADTWQLNPTLPMTVPMSQRVDFNPAVRLVIPTCENCDTLIAFTQASESTPAGVWCCGRKRRSSSTQGATTGLFGPLVWASRCDAELLNSLFELHGFC